VCVFFLTRNKVLNTDERNMLDMCVYICRNMGFKSLKCLFFWLNRASLSTSHILLK
jgi:hypothetical protein